MANPRRRHRDDRTDAVFQALNQSYLTPIDREDIGPLASALDDVMDNIEAVRRIALYKITTTTPLAANSAHRKLAEAARMELRVDRLRAQPFELDELIAPSRNSSRCRVPLG